MKNCRDIENDLPLYLDDSLSGADKKAVEEHLKSCPQCANVLVRLEKTGKLVDALPEVEPPVWFTQKIMAGVREEAQKKSILQKWFYPLRIKIPVQIFATVFLAVLAVYIYRAGEDRMNDVIPSSVPAPVAEAPQNALPGQKMKTSAEKIFHKEERSAAVREGTEEAARQTAVDAAGDINERVVSDVKDDGAAAAPAAKSLEQAGAESKKEKASYAPGVSGKAGGLLKAQSPPPGFGVMVRVADVHAAAEAVEKLLIRYAAENTARQMLQGKIILTAKLKGRNVKDFSMQLKAVGRIEESVVLAAQTDEPVAVMIEIVNK